jgi:hypothetical protein
MLDGVHMVWAGHLEKLLEVIGRLSRLVLKVTLSSVNMFLVRVIILLIVVTLVTISSNCDPLGMPLWPTLVAFGARLHAFGDCHRGPPSHWPRCKWP